MLPVPRKDHQHIHRAVKDLFKGEQGVLLFPTLLKLLARPPKMAMLPGVGSQPLIQVPHLPGDDCDFGYSCLSKCVEKLRTMPDDAPIFLCCA